MKKLVALLIDIILKKLVCQLYENPLSIGGKKNIQDISEKIFEKGLNTFNKYFANKNTTPLPFADKKVVFS